MSLLFRKEFFNIFSKLVSEIPMESLEKKLKNKINDGGYKNINAVILRLILNKLKYEICGKTLMHISNDCHLCNSKIVKFHYVFEATIKVENIYFYNTNYHEECLSRVLDFWKSRNRSSKFREMNILIGKVK
jgi:hypothetical protein